MCGYNLTFGPFKIHWSRASEGNNQAFKHNFCQSKICSQSQTLQHVTYKWPPLDSRPSNFCSMFHQFLCKKGARSICWCMWPGASMYGPSQHVAVTSSWWGCLWAICVSKMVLYDAWIHNCFLCTADQPFPLAKVLHATKPIYCTVDKGWWVWYTNCLKCCLLYPFARQSMALMSEEQVCIYSTLSALFYLLHFFPPSLRDWDVVIAVPKGKSVFSSTIPWCLTLPSLGSPQPLGYIVPPNIWEESRNMPYCVLCVV